MRVVQTFWTAGKSPLKESFGWLHPEYNLMSWALSCLSLRQHYDEVALYTDEQGKHVLIDLLHLPYTEVNVVYDEHLCLPQHWAYAKIKTYSMQTKPFLHVDGDVYLPNPLPENIANAPLIAQNREIGTQYYRQMVDRMLNYPEIVIPDYAKDALSEGSIVSYNMGFFGGHDIDFIHNYCTESLRFIEQNYLNNPTFCQSRANCNVFFEQILFAIIADLNKRNVATVLGREIEDEGYMSYDFCTLRNYDTHQFFHIIGGHKRNPGICNILEKLLLLKYSSWFMSIASLFLDRHVRLFLPDILHDSIQIEELLQEERMIVKSYSFIDMEEYERVDVVLVQNKFLHLLRENKEGSLVSVPSIGDKPDRIVSIAKLGENILMLLRRREMAVCELKEKLHVCFSKNMQARCNEVVDNELIYLLLNGIIHFN